MRSWRVKKSRLIMLFLQPSAYLSAWKETKILNVYCFLLLKTYKHINLTLNQNDYAWFVDPSEKLDKIHSLFITHLLWLKVNPWKFLVNTTLKHSIFRTSSIYRNSVHQKKKQYDLVGIYFLPIFLLSCWIFRGVRVLDTFILYACMIYKHRTNTCQQPNPSLYQKLR